MRGLFPYALLAIVVGACSSAPALPDGFCRRLLQAPEGMPIRFTTSGDRLVRIAVPTANSALSMSLRRLVEGIAPGGDIEWIGREWGPEGVAWRIEKTVPGTAETPPDFRSMLLFDDGRVWERSHQIPLDKVPHLVLRAAVRDGRSAVERTEVVWRGEREFFRVRTRNGAGWLFEVEVGIGGEILGIARVLVGEVRGSSS